MKKLLQLSSLAGRGKTRADIYDLHGLRAVVQPRQDLPQQQAEALAERACYRLQQLAEALWPPLAQRSKDYIARPKPNGYRSIHLTLAASAEEQQPGAASSADEDQLTSRLNSNSRASSSGQAPQAPQEQQQQEQQAQQQGWGAAAWQLGPVFVELQIRTALMDEQAEMGAAAHAGYKGGLDARQAQQLQSWTQELQRRLLQQPQQKLQLPAPSGPGLPAAAAAPGAAGGCSDAELAAAQAAAEGLFRHLDRDGDGRLSLDELQLVGGPALPLGAPACAAPCALLPLPACAPLPPLLTLLPHLPAPARS
jgi:ppGpp synthetase/RelA/SpoT-type nucleotidyltranferase